MRRLFVSLWMVAAAWAALAACDRDDGKKDQAKGASAPGTIAEDELVDGDPADGGGPVTPEPSPGPAVAPGPAPGPAPKPGPSPAPAPSPAPDPAPGPAPAPAPGTPVIQITTPTAALTRAADDAVTITVAIGNAAAGATWSLFRTASLHAKTGGTAIAESIPAATTSYTWSTTSVAPGEYFLYATLTSGATTTTARAAGSVLVSHPVAGNAEPTVTLNAPFAAGAAAVKLPSAVTYALADADPADVSGLTVKLEIYRDATDTWVTLADMHTDATTYTWTDPAATEAIDYRLRVTVADTRGGVGIARGTAAFGVTHTDYRYDTNMRAVFQARCGGSECHDAGAAFAGFYRWDVWNETTKGTVAKRDRILYRGLVDTFPMPPFNDLDDAQRAVYRAKLQIFDWQGWLKN